MKRKRENELYRVEMAHPKIILKKLSQKRMREYKKIYFKVG